MHAVVLVRYIYFLACFLFHLALAVVAAVSIFSPVSALPVPGGAAVFFLAIFGVLVLLGLLGFDLNRTRTGVAYFCFLSKIWFELSMMALLMFMHVVTFIIIFCQNKSHYCNPGAPGRDVTACTLLRLTWAFQILVAGTILLYVAYLGFFAALHYRATPQVFCAAVRDFPWGSRVARRKNKHDTEMPIYFPKMTLPAFDEAFPELHKTEGGLKH